MPYALFDTALGRCGLAWTSEGVTAVGLPESDDALVRYLTRFDAVSAAPDGVALGAVEAISALLDGFAVDLSTIPVVLTVSVFDRAVYDVTSSIPRGSTLTYGAVATRLGQPGAAQAVGGALGRNPVPVIVPCHRVLGAGREVGGFSAPGGASTKQKILAIEGVAGFGEPTLF
ncbi:methylated-DNA--[protein]-cysteine S-methyltransferase [Rhodococcus sp. G-MC3]|uniref:methylated-DNA--[protein]-cysteine S-methyltransferase n=1 Tax=Rhodococcus sp. G-MC3 TaxID=3046209 RepID=UPI0024BA7857|nr:methylated-DNA--[protein]-cysteine S-methyltransferase [Rhodococcus sp. G-MC3]MDJ0393315.1 methylated-DNA--[protein]-cysteine S-methyltransferase [Rhodococcus sp. G-MC3]